MYSHGVPLDLLNGLRTRKAVCPANAALLASLLDQIVKQLADATIDIPLYSAKSKERPPAVPMPTHGRLSRLTVRSGCVSEERPTCMWGMIYGLVDSNQ